MWGAAIGGLLGGIANYAGAQDTNRTNREIADAANRQSQANAREQMQFQERMSNSEITRRMADLKNAGINPLLAGRDAASSPSGAAGTAAAATMTNPVDAAVNVGAKAIEKGIQSKLASAQLENMGDQNALLKSQKSKTDMETFIMGKDAPKAELGAMAAKAISSAITSAKETWREATQVNEAKTKAETYPRQKTQKYDIMNEFQKPIPIGRPR